MTIQKKMHLTSLGCAKNLVDSEMMLGSLELEGYTTVEDPAEAELLLINTCGFIRPAVEEAVDEILRLAEYKQDDPTKKLVVTGCMVQRYGKDLQEELPEVDFFVGIDEELEIASLVKGWSPGSPSLFLKGPSSFLADSGVLRRLATPFFRSYLKITEGCDNRCTYCMIPMIRGDLRSRSVQDLIIEAKALEQGGVKELSLIAQDLTAYGDDLKAGENLVSLLEQLLAETEIPWFRLLYLYPSSVSVELLELMAEHPRILPYLDIPFQHVSGPVLQRMGRRYGQQELEQLITTIRRILPDCALRTTMMVGFPGETEDDIEKLIDCLQRWRLDHVGVFPYEAEQGSIAADLPEKVERKVREERFAQVMEVQAEVSAQRLEQYVGRKEVVLVEGVSQETDLLLEGRTRYQAPDIDGCVFINDGIANPGDIVTVEITEAHTYDLVGGITR
ncbi:MAG: 30S ribosomal protein S12 methylthiotransferase RimO [Candidatus Electrothrix sp. GW3-4]|uniref:30S ribosomal protein S12 methylthiotransferase RimO n=1 Tax=Candidatus Electrothrix sp. GW3-4 TaxID=3126740 RepID=UPI0030D4F8A4